MQGDVEATQKITIRKEGSLVGNIKTTGIIIEDDAYFKGSIDIVRNTGTAASRRRASAPPIAAEAQPIHPITLLQRKSRNKIAS